ncbi:MAG: hypothetical protein K0R41_91 [Geminicoccaceae bacterium]|nr:hypothetical protein [Solirubrobacterales bacterium]MCE3246266.1 hypothetical protein [Geminicoccaceae bacterium]
MTVIARLVVVLVLGLALAATLTAVSAAVAPAPAAAKTQLKAKHKGQKQIKRKKAIKVEVKGEKPDRKLKLRARSKTFDTQKFKNLTKKAVLRPGKRSVKLKLNKASREVLKRCEPRQIRITGKGAKRVKFDLRRNSKKCKPKPIDLSRAGECDFITVDDTSTAADSLCMLPFPDNFHTVDDEDSETGKRIAFDDAAMPRNSGGQPITAGDYNLNDGFSPGQTIVVRTPGLDTPEALAATDPVPLSQLGRFEERKTPVVVIDTEDGERWPIWVEIDANAEAPEDTALLIHPAKNWAAGHRYVVGMRRLKDAAGTELEPPEGFRYLRDDLPVKEQAVEDQRKRFDRVFRDLRREKIKRRDLYLAWDFTVATDENIAARMLHIRDDAFAQLGDTNLADVEVQGSSPSFQVTSVENFTEAEDPELARRIKGTYQVPCYLVPNCEPGGRFGLGADGLPSRNGTYTAEFNCGVPHAAGAQPARPQVYGHGLLGSASQATSGDQQILGQTHNFVICATTTIGFSSGDVPNIANNILPQLGNFPELTDRVQQGLLNTLFLGRLMIHEDGFVSDDAFHVDDTDIASPPLIDTSRLYYNGNSQGGILGGAATAVAPDWTRASLGVPAMNYSVLLNRSVDFDLYQTILDPAYPDPPTQQLALSLIQMLWDRSDPNGYAHRMTDNPLANTPAHEVLLNPAFGDHQVTTWQADVEARTIGASIHDPVVYEGRWPGVDVAWGIPRIESYPFTDSAIVYWDSGPPRPDPTDPGEVIGTDPPPLTNTPNRSGEDPHGDPRVAPAEMQMVSDFLRPDPQSLITDTCAGPCFAGGFTGP